MEAIQAGRKAPHPPASPAPTCGSVDQWESREWQRNPPWESGVGAKGTALRRRKKAEYKRKGRGGGGKVIVVRSVILTLKRGEGEEGHFGPAAGEVVLLPPPLPPLSPGEKPSMTYGDFKCMGCNL